MPTAARRVRRFVSALVCAALGGCLVVPEVSPEGTATTFALGKKAPVYAPRTARAQKVVFDDPSKELIFAPDTPLRKFFDERSRDFNPGDVDYAKTTILGDIVETLRGRDYLSRIVREIVDRHTDALRPAEVEGKWLAELGGLVQVLERATVEPVPPPGPRRIEVVNELKGSARKSWETLRGAAQETKTQATSAEAQAEWRRHEPIGPKVQPLAKAVGEADDGKVFGLARALRDELRAAHVALSLVQKIQGLSASAGQAASKLELAKIRERNAALLASSLEVALLHANYPDIRDKQVDDVLWNFAGQRVPEPTHVDPTGPKEDTRAVWLQTTLDGERGSSSAAPFAERAVAGFVLDLRETLKAREFLQRAIDDAVEKRKGLFRSGGASLVGLQSAQAVFSDFIQKNLGAELAPVLFDDKATLWGAFLASQSEADDPIAKKNLPLKPEELAAFGESLRRAVQAELSKGTKLDKALGEAIGKDGRSEFLRAKNSEGLLDPTAQATWKDKLHAHGPLLEAYAQLIVRMVERAAKEEALAGSTKDRAANLEAVKAQFLILQGDYSSALTANKDLMRVLGEVLGVFTALQHRDSDAWKKKGSTERASEVSRLTAVLQAADIETAGYLLYLWASVDLDVPNKGVEAAWSDVLARQKNVTGSLEAALGATKSRQALLSRLQASVTDLDALEGLLNEAPQKVDPTKVSAAVNEWKKALDRLCDAALKEPITTHHALATKLKAATGELEGAIKEPAIDRLGEVNTSLDALSKSVKALDPWRSKADVFKVSQDKVTAAEKEVREADEKVQAQGGSLTTKGGLSFAAGLQSAIAEVNQALTAQQRLDPERLAAHLHTKILEILGARRSKTAPADYGKLEEHLVSVLKTFGIDLDRTDALAKLTARFAEVFAGHEDLVSSGEPILKALLASKAIRFVLEENRARALAAFPGLFLAARKDPELTTTTPKLPDELAKAARKALEAPQMVVLFGQGAVNEGLARAFSLELFRAFQYRIQEAIDAERQADYDYWWLTLYPKAVPVGGRSFDGESLVEVSFADSLVPEEQYHRWLTDLGRVVSGNRGGAVEGEQKRVRAATVLTNFMLVLDSSELTGRHEGIREAVLETLRRLTADEGRASDAYENGCRYLYEQVEAELGRKALGEDWQMVEDLRDSGVKMLCEFDSRGLNQIRVNRAGEAGAFFKCYAEFLEGDCHVERPEATRAAQELAWVEFGLEHILLAVIDAAESGLLLPAQVNLYLNAFFSGEARFQAHIEPQEIEFARRILTCCQYSELHDDLTRNYVVPFESWSDRNELGNFLALSGLDTWSLKQLKERFDYLRREHVSWPVVPHRYEDHLRSLKELEAEVRVLRKTTRLSEMIEQYSGFSAKAQEDLHRLIMDGIKYRPGVTPSRYLEYPQLWFWEMRLGGLRAELRRDTSQLFHSSYPAVPDRERLRAEFSRDDWRLQTLAYQWIRDLWVVCKARGFLGGGGDPTASPLQMLVEQMPDALRNLFECLTQEAHGRDQDPSSRTEDARVLVALFLERYPFLSLDTVEFLSGQLPQKASIYDWMETITSSQGLMDQLSSHLLDELYGPLFDVLWQLSQTDRHPLAMNKLERNDYLRFLDWAKPDLQQGIQIVDMLPSSRDDLVSLSVNEGGVVAELAGKVDASITYEANQLAMLQRAAQSLRSTLDAGDEGGRTEEPLDPADLTAGLRTGEQLTEFEDMLRSARLGRENRMQGQSLAASARGSLFGEARAAFAYARRREYLDAAITAAGRGDNVARWVIRRSDVRSNLTSGDQRKNLAAAHNGQPNGDQPFHLLLKVPRGAVHTDWEDRRYILFNSSYSATARSNKSRELGHLKLVLEPLMWLLKPDALKNLESSLVVSSFPFRWDVPYEGSCDAGDAQRELIREPNLLGGRIELDDTDKVRYSDILSMVAAESEFVRTTRGLQLGEVQTKLDSLDADSKKLNDEVQKQLIARLSDFKTRYEAQLAETGLAELRTDLGKRIEEIEARIDELEKEAAQPPVSNN